MQCSFDVYKTQTLQHAVSHAQKMEGGNSFTGLLDSRRRKLHPESSSTLQQRGGMELLGAIALAANLYLGYIEIQNTEDSDRLTDGSVNYDLTTKIIRKILKILKLLAGAGAA